MNYTATPNDKGGLDFTDAPSDPKDPQAELREAIGNQYQLWLRDPTAQIGPERITVGHNFDSLTDRLVKLFQAHQQQLLTELLGELPEKVDMKTVAHQKDRQPQFYAAGFNAYAHEVVSVIEQKLKQTNDGGKNGDNL